MSLKRRLVFQYVSMDYISSAIAWTLFFLFRKLYIEKPWQFEPQDILHDERYWVGIAVVPIFWVLLYGIGGFYHTPLHKSRLNEFINTFWVCVTGTMIIFFLLILDDHLNYNYKGYYKSLMALLSIQFLLNYFPKFFITSTTTHKVHNRIIGFNSLLIGTGDKAVKLFSELNSAKKSAGYLFMGFMNAEPSDTAKDSELASKHQLKYLGQIDEIGKIIEEQKIVQVVIAVEKEESKTIRTLISKLQAYDVRIKMIPKLESIAAGQVKMKSILHAALIEINFDNIPYWHRIAKRVFDVSVSLFFLILLSPLFAILAILIKTGSEGPVFFRQERIGKKGQPFNIIKFRSMYLNSEAAGPQLSKENDKRITPVGRFLRKSRMDEIPQFYNVLKGEMSIVGPRPERAFFIEKITKRTPEYRFLYKIKPGITSWGQVKYGYAENVDEMIERLKFDLIYLENRSFLVDLKILIYTALVIVKGKGK